MDFIDEKIEEYAFDHTSYEGDLLEQLEKETYKKLEIPTYTIYTILWNYPYINTFSTRYQHYHDHQCNYYRDALHRWNRLALSCRYHRLRGHRAVLQNY